MVNIGIMGNGPSKVLPDLSLYKQEIDVWIGADRGALLLINNGIKVNYALGDFDSTFSDETERIKKNSTHFIQYPVEKDKTDIEIALLKAFEKQPKKIYLFGVTGGRLDHELINIQLLYSIITKGIQGIIVDKDNELELTFPNRYTIERNEHYPNISFIPYSEHVKGLTLDGFYYPLEKVNISWGSTLCISNKLLRKSGTFSYEEGILLVIKSRDASSHPIPM